MANSTLRTLRFVTSLALVALLAGACASTSPPMRFYLLSPIEQPTPAGTLGETVVLVGPLQLPGYLDRPQVVVRQPDGRMALREFERWGEPLDAHLTDTVVANLFRLTGSPRVVAFPLPGRVSADRRILGRVIRFDVDSTGLAVLEMQWSLWDGTGEPLVPVRIDAYRAQAAGTETAALVAALSDVVTQFSRQVAGELVASLE